MNPHDIYKFIEGRRLAVLASVGPDQKPQAALMGIAVTEGLEIVFDTVRSTRKYANLKSRPSAAFVIGWAGEITLQYEGRAREVSGKELEPYQQLYFEKWPDGQFRAKMPDTVYFVVEPKWIRYSDYSTAPPTIEEFNF
jgi:general stress protein 26